MMTPVERTSRDEVGDLAEAFASIQETAVSVAIEQSNLLRKGIGELFVNLARRNQSLLDFVKGDSATFRSACSWLIERALAAVPGVRRRAAAPERGSGRAREPLQARPPRNPDAAQR